MKHNCFLKLSFYPSVSTN